MNVLLVEDEAGIREGLAALLRLKGHVVHTADTAAAGSAVLEQRQFDLVVTDWRLGDDTALGIAARCRGPLLVMTGHAGDVPLRGPELTVLRKPVRPSELLDQLEALARRRTDSAAAPAARALPADVRDRLALARAVLGDPPGARVTEVGDCVLLEVPLAGAGAEQAKATELLARLGGDLRVLHAGDGATIELRLSRDGRPDDVAAIGPGEPWPQGDAPLAIDFDRGTCSPQAFLPLLERCAQSARAGREVHLLNMPGHLRLLAEILDGAPVLPKRAPSGPRLPEVLTELWSSA
jgi:CheY-like chemotaxis protein